MLTEYGSLYSVKYKWLSLTINNADAMIERNQKMLSYRAAELREVLSLQNWVNSNACLARAETAYLTRYNELLSVAPSRDGVSEQMEGWVEDKLMRFCKTFQKVGICILDTSYRHKLTYNPRALVGVSQETHRYIYSPVI